jgi:hypothetical protein
LAETAVNAGTEEAYERLKNQLNRYKCKIIADQAPNSISAIQGSLWGTAPKTAQKNIIFNLQQNTPETRVTSSSKLTSGYIRLTLAGCALSVVVMLVCAWIVLDLQAYVSAGTAGLWNWLGQIDGHLDADKAALFIRLDLILAVFLASTLVVETVVVARIRAKIGTFAKEVLKNLQ